MAGIDAGFAADKWIHPFGFYHGRRPTRRGRPADIEKVFLTHMHFDHGNNLPAFPNAFDRVTMELRSRSVGEKAFAYRYLGWPGAPGQAEPD